MKLISSIENGKRLSELLQLGEIDYKQYFIYRTEDDDFLELPPHPSQFVAMDDDGNVLEEPKTCCSGRDCGCMGFPYNYTSQEHLDEYCVAQSKVIFEGFKPKKESSKEITILSNGFIDIEFWNYSNGNTEIYATDFSQEKPFKKSVKTISNLIPYNLTLTAKQIIGV